MVVFLACREQGSFLERRLTAIDFLILVEAKYFFPQDVTKEYQSLEYSLVPTYHLLCFSPKFSDYNRAYM